MSESVYVVYVIICTYYCITTGEKLRKISIEIYWGRFMYRCAAAYVPFFKHERRRVPCNRHSVGARLRLHNSFTLDVFSLCEVEVYGALGKTHA